MSEQGRDPLIRLPIDQEVFMEAVNQNDTLEDATVTTEVVSFQRDGEAYELEGAIVFAGYLRNPEQTADTSYSLGVEDETEDTVEHVHHRMPFILRVPISAQGTGIVNVKSRLSGWALDVVGDKWLNVKGVLEIHGLVGDEGYHFRCGAQEDGNLFFNAVDETVEDSAANVDVAFVENEAPAAEAVEETLAQPTETREESAEMDEQNGEIQDQPVAQSDERELTAVGATEDLWRGVPDDDEQNPSKPTEESSAHHDSTEDARRVAANDALENVSEARGGHGWADGESNDKQDDRSAAVAQPTSPKETVRQELANLDRYFVPQSETEDAQNETNSFAAEPAQRSETTPVASFEFEHQIDDEHALGAETAVEDEQPADLRGDESWMPKFTISGAVATEDTEESEAEAPSDEVRHEMPTSAESVTKSELWSFVDFNGPEPHYTLRYVVVMEDETLEAVADRCSCSTTELQRVNNWLDGQVTPGQALQIPITPPLSLPHVSL
ncbi:hypothetical protein [Alicyclobacillus fodiniaquatilis]|uniref:LysM domain-containing protein n=1 Tax=Alicyclobacillus fodiniaquatilis TaxID=1661150 RepID=A0ABW4JIV4_9BACL